MFYDHCDLYHAFKYPKPTRRSPFRGDGILPDYEVGKVHQVWLLPRDVLHQEQAEPLPAHSDGARERQEEEGIGTIIDTKYYENYVDCNWVCNGLFSSTGMGTWAGNCEGKPNVLQKKGRREWQEISVDQ